MPGAGNIVHTLGNLGYAPVNLGATTDYYGLYAVDALDLTDALTITAGLRVNAADISDPRPQRHRRRTHRQPRLWPFQSAGRR